MHESDNSKALNMDDVKASVTFVIIYHNCAVMLLLVLEKRCPEVENKIQHARKSRREEIAFKKNNRDQL